MSARARPASPSPPPRPGGACVPLGTTSASPPARPVGTGISAGMGAAFGPSSSAPALRGASFVSCAPAVPSTSSLVPVVAEPLRFHQAGGWSTPRSTPHPAGPCQVLQGAAAAAASQPSTAPSVTSFVPAILPSLPSFLPRSQSCHGLDVGGRAGTPRRDPQCGEWDALLQRVQRFLWAHPDVAKKNTVVRSQIHGGVYEVNGRVVGLEWQASEKASGGGADSSDGQLVVIDGAMRFPLSDYLGMEDLSTTYSCRRIDTTTALHCVPKERRMTFEDGNGECSDRIEAMVVAKKQAQIRERAADFTKAGKRVPEDLLRRCKSTPKELLHTRLANPDRAALDEAIANARADSTLIPAWPGKACTQTMSARGAPSSSCAASPPAPAATPMSARAGYFSWLQPTHDVVLQPMGSHTPAPPGPPSYVPPAPALPHASVPALGKQCSSMPNLTGHGQRSLPAPPLQPSAHGPAAWQPAAPVPQAPQHGTPAWHPAPRALRGPPPASCMPASLGHGGGPGWPFPMAGATAAPGRG